MEMRLLWVIVLVGLVVWAQTPVINCCVREEREALLNIKKYFVPNYNGSLVEKQLSSWVGDPKSDCCKWSRVKCHPSSGLVSSLSLQTLNIISYPLEDPLPLSGYASVSIDFSMYQHFKELTSLNLSRSQIHSLENTAVLANLSNLEVLVLKSSGIEGSLPLQDICKLKKIRVLDFSYNSFNGSLHKCLANLTSLQALDLSDNQLIGQIPASSIAALTSLEYFSATDNYFTGSFPLSSFSNNSRLKVLSLQMYTSEFQVTTESEALPLFQLEVLHLADCKLNSPSGTFPSFLLYQHDLHYLDLSNNDLVGVFPNWLLLNNTNLRYLIAYDNNFIGRFESLTNTDQPHPHPVINLQLSGNKMEGKLPKNIDLMFPYLEYLSVSRNGLKGSIPPSIGNMSKLIALDLSRNKFSGQIPESLWSGCASLAYLILSHNNLDGKFLPSHLNSSSLKILSLDSNYLSGTLEHHMWHFLYLETLDISNNRFSGVVPSFMANSSSLNVIKLSRNNIAGALPKDLCKLSLTYLDLSHNNLSSSIPACYLNMFSLQLQGNSLVGRIPTLMKSSSDYPLLSTLDLRDNKLTGVIPDSIMKMEFLSALLLGGNQLHGEIPNQLCQLKSLNLLDLSRNKFIGNIPACFNSFSNDGITMATSILHASDIFYTYNSLHLQLYYEQNGNYITEEELEIDFMTKNLLLPYQGDILGLMSGIDLSSNQLAGNIPEEIGYLNSLHALNLSHNHLNGSIPKSFQNLSAIESIDLSNNNMEGEIPIEFQDLNFLGVFNVSFNNLSGRVPSGLTFDDSSFTGNKYLIWNTSNKGNSTHTHPPPPNNDTEEDNLFIDFTSFIWSFSTCYIAVLVIMATVLWINPYWRRLWFYFIDTCLYICLYPHLKDAFW